MKRVFAVLLALMLLIGCALAEPRTIDLNTMTIEELSDLQRSIQIYMFTHADWESVQVPAGVYQVGVEIPAGTWTLKPVADQYTYIMVTDALNLTRTDAGDDAEIYFSQTIASKGTTMYSIEPVSAFTVTLLDGMYIIIQDGDCLFTTPVTPAFQFK